MFYRIVETKRLDSQLYARVPVLGNPQEAPAGKPPPPQEGFL